MDVFYRIDVVRKSTQAKPNRFGTHTHALVAGLAEAIESGTHVDELSTTVAGIVGCYYADATEGKELRTFLDLGEGLIRAVTAATDAGPIMFAAITESHFYESEARIASMRE